MSADRDSVLGAALSTAAILASSVALLDLTAVTLLDPRSLDLNRGAWLPFLLLAGLMFAAQMLSWGMWWLAARIVLREFDGRALAVSVASGNALLILLIRLYGFLRPSSWIETSVGPILEQAQDRDRILPAAALLLATVVGGLLFVAATRCRRDRSRAAAVRGWLLALLLAAMLGSIGLAFTREQSPTVRAAVAIVAAVAAVVPLTRWCRRRSVTALALCCCLSAVASVALLDLARSRRTSGSGAAHRSSTRHVLLITIDSLRADALSAYGGTGVETPHLDALAHEGMLFERAYSPSSWTLPSLSSVMSGVSPRVHLTTGPNGRLPASMETLAERMAAAGYTTAAVGYNDFLNPQTGLGQGFEYYDAFPKNLLDKHSLGNALLYRWLGPRGETEELTRLAGDWMIEHADEDFFFWLHYFDPHAFYTPPEPYRPPGDPPPGMTHGFYLIAEGRKGELQHNDAERNWIRALYDGEVRFVDDSIGRLFARLEAMRLLDDTLIVVTSDHGEEFWDHERMEHGHTLYDELLHVPLIVKLPGESSGRRIPTGVSTGSLLPTVLDLCGIPDDPARRSYPSLASAILGEVDPLERPLEAGSVLYGEAREAIRFGRHKYIVALESGTEELYDLIEDPDERHSLLPAESAVAAEGARLLHAIGAAAESLRGSYGVEAAERAVMDPAVLRHLRSLGYVD